MHQFVAASVALLSLAGSSLACEVVNGVKFTAYGYPDASGIPAYKCQNGKPVNTGPNDKTELGDGSFGNPYAAAASRDSVFKRCDVLYMPLLKKYFRVQDDCSGCVSKQTDLYIVQSNKNIGQSGCETAFGTFNYGKPLHEVIRNPGRGFSTNTKPLFKNNKCFNKVSDGRIFPRADGNVKCPRPGSASTKEVVETPPAGDNTIAFTDVAQLVQDDSGKNGTTTPAPDAGKVVVEAPGEIAEGVDDANAAKEKRHARDFDSQLEEEAAEVEKRGRGGYN